MDIIYLSGFVKEFVCFAANSLAKTIFTHLFCHGFQPVATDIFSLTGKVLSLLLF